MKSIDTLPAEELQAYALALKLLGMTFYLPPSQPFLTNLVDAELLTGWPLAPDAPHAQRGLQLLNTALCSAPAAHLLSALQSDYTALFIGLEEVEAPPWESVYLSRDHLLFDEQTLEVRQAYARFGLQIPKLEREPDDHIGFELLFLSHVMSQAAQVLADGDAAAAHKLLQAALSFLEVHPLRWVEPFVARVDRFARTDYYRGLAFLLAGSLAGLADLLEEATVDEGAEDEQQA